MIVFRNNDVKAIKKLLKEIGVERYKCALKDEGISQPPISMNGFYLEYDTSTGNIGLFHKYPSKITLFIMSVLGYWSLPIGGWEMVRKV